jgi:predicted transcriptional regulator
VTVRVPVGGPGSGVATPVDNAGSEAGFQQALGQTVKVPVRPTPRAPAPRGPTPRGPTPSGPSGGRPDAARALNEPDSRQPVERQGKKAPDTPAVPGPSQLGKGGAAVAAQPADRGTVPGGTAGQFSTIGERLVAMRRQMGITQVDLARRMGSTQPALARLEKGDMKPNLRTLGRYGEAIGQRVQVSFAKDGTGASAGSADTTAKAGQVGTSLAQGGEPLAVCTIDQVPEAVGQVRRALGLTQVQVAIAMDSSQPVIARLETGDGIPNLRTLERYCDALGVTAEIRFEAVGDRDE